MSSQNEPSSNLAQPLRYQHLEQNLTLEPYLDFVENVFNAPISDDDAITDSDEDSDAGRYGPNGIYNSRDEARQERSYNFNFSEVGPDRNWLRNVLLSESEPSEDSTDVSDEERSARDDARIREMLKEHVVMKKYRAKFAANPELKQYQYYGSGLVSSIDRFPAHRAAICKEISQRSGSTHSPDTSNKKRKSKHSEPGTSGEHKPTKKPKKEPKDFDATDGYDESEAWGDPCEDSESFSPITVKPGKSKKKSSAANTVEAMNARRRKLWLHISKKEIGKTQRARSSNHKEVLSACKRAAQMCMKVCRAKAMQSQKNMKETMWRMKRLTREMQTLWKRQDRVERETRRRMEREAEEQRKMDVEMMEAKRQQRKLNFLITQTELYAHFMQRKLAFSSTQSEELARILGQLDEGEKPARLAAIDDYDSEVMKNKAQQNVDQALNLDQARVQQFPLNKPDDPEVTEEQPKMFSGVLKHYQIKGVSWLANLYDQGINGILADEMGLGKTVQSIAFLCHIAEKYSIWGPFLVISPASTLHNWQQEFARFVPQFKVIPYWGNPQERRILRQFWAQKNVHTEDASFHVVITSYQLVVADIKYFNRVKWQYLVLDEAQAIKSSSSVRWKSLLGFQCRNRLLLSGTPVQNSMAELWALLHFIMPTLFDNHEEFAEWFSKDIESHAENKGSIDEKHLSRLHMILKPFMLRRIKKDVENELSDKIELMVYCPLTTRQKLLYSALKKKIRIEDLLYSSSSNTTSSVTSSLMNLVMQFRKVCNHPELFERQEPKVSYHCRPLNQELPCLIFNDSLLPDLNPEARRNVIKLLSIFSAQNVHHSAVGSSSYRTFSFSRLLDISPQDIEDVNLYGPTKIWELTAREKRPRKLCLELPKIKFEPQEGLPKLLFTKNVGCQIHSFGTVKLHSMPETLEHRAMRSSKIHVKPEPPILDVAALAAGPSLARTNVMFGQTIQKVTPVPAAPAKRVILPEFKYVPTPTQVLECQALELPKFLTHTSLKVDSRSRKAYSYSRRAANTFASMQSRVTQLLSHRLTPVTEHVPWGCSPERGGFEGALPIHGWSTILIPDKQSLISDAGKLSILDGMLHRLKSQGHRVLVYSQMTKMIDLLEEFMYYRKHTYMRLDGSSKISERRDMVADFQNREDIFVFLLSTRAGGLGINLTAADTVIFYDSDWNPTVDQQAMDRAHRLGQTKQVTVYRLICKDTIEERILQRAQEKSEIQRMVISGGSFKPDTLKPTEVVSLLLDDAEIERKYRQKQAERRGLEERKPQQQSVPASVQPKLEPVKFLEEETSRPTSPSVGDDDSDGTLVVDVEGLPPTSLSPTSGGRSHFQPTSSKILSAVRGLSSQNRGIHGRTRGRPRGSRGRGRIPTRPGLPDSSLEAMGIPSVPSLSTSPIPSSAPGIRRGPGRPRLKPYGPSHQGSRRGKKSGSADTSPSSSGPGTPTSSGHMSGSASSREIKEREFKAFSAFLQ